MTGEGFKETGESRVAQRLSISLTETKDSPGTGQLGNELRGSVLQRE